MSASEVLHTNLLAVDTQIYTKLSLKITSMRPLKEGTEYEACEFVLNGLKIHSRSAKITPTKLGQFVTFWKRNEQGATTPYSNDEFFDFLVVNTRLGDRLGQFVFPKSVLIAQGYITSAMKPGKRGFRVYPAWDTAVNKQAVKTQQWQLQYFYEVCPQLDLNVVRTLYTLE
ncbi:hypothetical protein SAMN05216480_1212 [Pustulibacterium marinum]|uniref:MepB protein n=1 Tax=Pustulibacterium marinum TaxID=1224947 RepID=A0A1I7ISH3_9FLAO|nr:MepB family protein [Pustulibacterium marinum]SFU75842.1 hypothetical protein SAMN05216480_1212 [Pustulibacterium marinum]